MIDEAARPEFSNGEEPGALQVGADPFAEATRDEGVQGQAGEVVSGQEVFRRQIAVGVEVRAAAAAATFEQHDLFVGLCLLAFRFLPVLGPQTVHLRAAVRVLQLGESRTVELAPPAERVVELGKRSRGYGGGKGTVVASPGRAFRAELIRDAREEGFHAQGGAPGQVRILEPLGEVRPQGQPLHRPVEQGGDFAGQLDPGLGEPDSVQVGAH